VKDGKIDNDRKWVKTVMNRRKSGCVTDKGRISLLPNVLYKIGKWPNLDKQPNHHSHGKLGLN